MRGRHATASSLDSIACLDKGSSLGEMTEALHVTNAIRGGASLVHEVEMRKIAEKLSM